MEHEGLGCGTGCSPNTQAAEAEGHGFKAVLTYTISLYLKRPDPLSQRSPQGSDYLDLILKWLPECKDAPITNDENLTKESSPCAGEHSALYSAWQPCWPQSTVELRAELRSLHAHLRTYRSPGADTGTRRESPSSQDLGL